MMTKKECSDKKPVKSNISKTLKCYFIPHEDNNHRPFILRPNALKFYSIVLILTKLIVTGFLYFSYPSVGFFSSATVSNIINLTNSSREENNIQPLKTSEVLNRAAFQKAQDMVANNYFSHESPAGAHFWNWIQGAGYQYSNAGENLAMDFNSAESVHQALLASASHRKNILNSNFTDIGISVISGKINNKETMILVQMFGTPKVAVAINPALKEPIPETTPETIPSSPFFRGEVVRTKEESLNIKPGEELNYWVEIKNTGNTEWTSAGENYVALNTTDPAGRKSVFEHDSWIEFYRPAKLTDQNVAPSQTTKFEFTLKAPEKTGEYSETFQLVAENLTWIEGSNFTIPIIVTESTTNNTSTAAEITQAPPEINAIAIINSTDPNAGQIIQKEAVPIIAQNQISEKSNSFIDYLIKYYDLIFWAIIILVGISLIINTFVKIKIQHADTIIPSLLVILLATLMLILRFHFIENLMIQPIIL